MQKCDHQQSGFITFKKLIHLTLLAGILYYGFWTCKFYYDYFMIQFYIRDQFREAHIYPRHITLDKIYKRIDELGTPIYSEDIILKDDDEKISMQINYSESLYFYDYHLLEIPFQIYEVRYFK